MPVNFTGAARRAVVVNGQLPAPTAAHAPGRHGHDPRHQPAARADLHPLARIHRARGHGWRAGTVLRRHRAGRHVHLPLQGEPVRHLLVSLALALPGADRPVRPDRHRTARRRAPRAPTASTCCCCRTGRTTIRSTSTPRSSARATTTTSASARCGFLRTTCAPAAGTRRAPSGACGTRMRMDPTDLADVSGYAYTYLLNGVAPGGQLDRHASSPANACGCG